MTAEKFYDLLIRTIRASNSSDKTEILALLKYAYITFAPQYAFTTKSWQHYEDVEIRVSPEIKARLEQYLPQLTKWCAEIYEETDDYDIGKTVIRIGEGNGMDCIAQEVFFEDLQHQIIGQIDAAKYLIWVAVAWFTDPILFRKLKAKKAQGINVQVIIDDDDINRTSGLPFEDEFETLRIPAFGAYLNNILHHKFCVIDLETVIHGSYNWSKKAQYNKETLSIETNREIAEKFTDEFIRIKREGR